MKSYDAFNNASNEKSSFIKKIFDDISSRYDLLNGILSLGVYKSWHNRVMKESGLYRDGSMIDFCTGTGELLLKSYKRFNLSRAVGIDISKCMLEIASKKTGMLRNIELYNVPAENTGIIGRFDCATIAFALRNVQDVHAVFNEMERLIKPGGRVVALELTTPDACILKTLHKFNLEVIIPFIGRILSGNREAYTYLGKSIMNFPKPDIIIDIMEKSGLINNRFIRLSSGIATIFTGEKII